MQKSTHPLRILVAEDTPANEMLAVRLLENRGHTVLVARDGREAVEVFNHEPVDLVVMDIQMPEMDGLAATVEIRKRQRKVQGRPIPIVALSAHSSRYYREQCLAAGMDAFVAKPLDLRAFLDLIEGLCADAPGGRPAAEVREPAAVDGAAALKRFDHDSSLFVQMINLFAHEGPRALEQCRAAIEARDEVKLQQAAHNLRVLASNFDARLVVESAMRLESLARDADFETAASVCKLSDTRLHQAAEELEAFGQKLGAETPKAAK